MIILNGKALQVFFLLTDYVESLMSTVEQLATEYSMNSSNVGQHHHAPPPLCSQYQHPDKTKAVEEKLSRFNHSFNFEDDDSSACCLNTQTHFFVHYSYLVMTPHSVKLDLYKNEYMHYHMACLYRKIW